MSKAKTVSHFDFLNSVLSLDLNNVIVIKCILIFIASGVVGFYYLLFDFSKLFPEKFEIIVKFNDLNKVEEMIKSFGITKVDGYDIEIKSESQLAEYINSGDSQLKKIFKFDNYYSDIFPDDSSPVTTTGTATFIVKKMGGLHNYKIESSTGILNHQKLNTTKNKTELWDSKFTNVECDKNIIDIKKVKDLFNKIILEPKFTQSIIRDKNKAEILDHTLYGVSYIIPLPFPTFSDTIYFYRKGNKVIPIGYAKNYTAR